MNAINTAAAAIKAFELSNPASLFITPYEFNCKGSVNVTAIRLNGGVGSLLIDGALNENQISALSYWLSNPTSFERNDLGELAEAAIDAGGDENLPLFTAVVTIDVPMQATIKVRAKTDRQADMLFRRAALSNAPKGFSFRDDLTDPSTASVNNVVRTEPTVNIA